MIDDNTLVRYHGKKRVYWGDLAFIRESDIVGDRREYTLDLVCYHPEDMDWDDDNYINTFGSVKATTSEFTVVALPDLPSPLEPGNYVVGTYPWRRSSDGSWDRWAGAGLWELQGTADDVGMQEVGAIFIGPLPKP